MKIISAVDIPKVENFLDVLGQSFLDMQEKYGINALALAAQCALETGWLADVISVHPDPADNNDGIPSYNVFNVEYAGAGNWGWAWVSQDVVENGFTVRKYEWEKMRKYGSYDDALEDLIALISGSSRYSAAWAGAGPAGRRVRNGKRRAGKS